MKITITKHEFKQFYIYNYYYGQNRVVTTMRMFMGPILTAIGLYLFLYSNIKESSVAGYWLVAICLAYGVFYTVKPLLLVITQGAKDESFEFKINKKNLHIKDRVKEGTIDLKENPLVENKKYFFIKLKNKQVIFFPKESIDKNQQEKFREALRSK